MLSSRSARTLGALVPVAAIALGLSGCTGANPGAAVVVSGDSVSISEVDRLAKDLCTVVKESQQQQSALPMSALRHSVVQSVATELVAKAYVADRDLSVDETAYNDQIKSFREQVSGLGEDSNDLVRTMASDAYLRSALVAGGAKALGEPEPTEPPSEADSQRLTQAGAQDLAAFLDSETVDIDPRFQFEFSEGRLVTNSTQLAAGVSDLAKAADSSLEEPSAAYAESLPADQRCG